MLLNISSIEVNLEIELSYLKNVFMEYNNYPLKFIENIIETEINKSNMQKIEQPSTKPEIINLS